MKLIDKLLVFTGKKDFKIDEKISIAYIMRVCWKYGWMMIRGRIFSIGRRNISNNIFVGKHVQVLEKRYLHMESKCKIHDDVYIDALSQDGVILGNGVVLGRGTTFLPTLIPPAAPKKQSLPNVVPSPITIPLPTYCKLPVHSILVPRPRTTPCTSIGKKI